MSQDIKQHGIRNSHITAIAPGQTHLNVGKVVNRGEFV
ncbi:hypothetical protein, partial [uncultured Nostoc sp.]